MGRSIKTAGAVKRNSHAKETVPFQAHAAHRKSRLLEKLYERIEQLETEKDLHNQVVQALQDLEQRYKSLVENIPDVVYSLDEEGTVLTVNKASVIFGYTQQELVGQSFVNLIHPDDRDQVANTYYEIVARRKSLSKTQQFRVITKSGGIRWFEANCSIRFSPKGQFIMQEGVCRDITESIHNQSTLIKAREALEAQVDIRTRELLQANAELQKKIKERAATEKALRDREAELEMEKANLKEANTALKVLLKRREVDKRALEEQVLYNVKKLVLPYLSKVQKESADENHKTYLGIVESNLRDVTCGFSRRLSLEFYGLSTSELKVANFIRQGKKNKEIADLLGLSVRTVETFRQGIRQKLRLQNKKVNLRTFLMSIN